MEHTLFEWLFQAAPTALGIVIWAKIEQAEKKTDRILQVELRHMDVRMSVIEQHLGMPTPARPD